MQNELKSFFRPQQGVELNFCKVCVSFNLLLWQQPCKSCVHCSTYKEPEQTESYHRQWHEAVGTNYLEVREVEQGRREADTVDTTPDKTNEDDSRPAQEILDPRTGEPMCFV